MWQTPEKPIINEKNTTPCQERNQQKKLKTMLKGVQPSSSVTVSKLTADEILSRYKKNEPYFSFTSSESYSSKYRNSTDLILFRNNSEVCEDIASLSMRVQQKFIALETMSTCNVWFQASVPLTASAKKRSRAKQRIGMSPGQRLSHLARRKQIFSRANLQRMADQDRKRVIEIKKNGIYQDKKSESFHFEKLNTSKRALFMSPEDDLNQSGRVKEFPKRKLFGSSEKKKKVPLKENSKRSEVKRWLFQQNFKSTEVVSRKRLRDENYGDVPERKTKCPRRSLTFNEEEESSRSPGTSSTYSSVSLPPLSENHKNKLLWAVSVVLKEANLTRKDPNFKKCASSLFMTCRKNFNKILSYQMESTSEKILHFARQSIPSLLEKLGLENPNASREALTPVKQNHETQSKPNEGGKENLDDSSVVFKTPIKFLRVKKKSKTCDKFSNKIRFKGVLVRCKSLESLAEAKTPEKKFVKKLFDCDNLNHSSFVHDESLDASLLNDSDVNSSQILAPSSVTEENEGFSLFSALKKAGEESVDSGESEEIRNQGFKGPSRIEESEDERIEESEDEDRQEKSEGQARIEESEEEDLFEECENMGNNDGLTYSLTYEKLEDELEREKDIFEDDSDDKSQDLKDDFKESDEERKSVFSLNLVLQPEQSAEPELEPEPKAELEAEVYLEQELKSEPEPDPEVEIEQEQGKRSRVKSGFEVYLERELEQEPELVQEPVLEILPELQLDLKQEEEPGLKLEWPVENKSEVELELMKEPESGSESKVETVPESQSVLEQEPGLKLEPTVAKKAALEQELIEEPELEANLSVISNSEGKKLEVASPGENQELKLTTKSEPLLQLEPSTEPKVDDKAAQETQLKQEPEPELNLQPEISLEPEKKPPHESKIELELDPEPKLEPKLEIEREPAEEPAETECDLQAESEPELEAEAEAEVEVNASAICDDLMHPPETSTPKSPAIKSKSRKLKVKKSKKNWKIVEAESDDDVPLSNLRNLKLKVRLSHEWEVVSKNFSTSDIDNSMNFSAQQSRSQLDTEGNTMEEREIPDSSDVEEQSTRNTFEKSGYLESESEVEVKEEPEIEEESTGFEKSGWLESESEAEVKEETDLGGNFEKSGWLESESEVDVKEEQTVDESDVDVKEEPTEDVDAPEETLEQLSEEKNFNEIEPVDLAEDHRDEPESVQEDNDESRAAESNNSLEKLLEKNNFVEIESEPLVKIDKSPESAESNVESQDGYVSQSSNTVDSDAFSTVDHAALKEMIKPVESIERDENSYVTPGKRAGSPVLGSSIKKRVLSLEDYKARAHVEKPSTSNDLEGITPLNVDSEEEHPKKVYNIRLKHPVNRHRHRKSRVSMDHKSRKSEESVKNEPEVEEESRSEEEKADAKMQAMFDALTAASILLDQQITESVEKHGSVKEKIIAKSLEAMAAINEEINKELEERLKNPENAVSVKRWLDLLSKHHDNLSILKLGKEKKKHVKVDKSPESQQKPAEEVSTDKSEENMQNKFDALLAATALLDQQINESVKKHGAVKQEDIVKSLEVIAAINEAINQELEEWMKNPENAELTKKWIKLLSRNFENSPMAKLKAEREKIKQAAEQSPPKQIVEEQPRPVENVARNRPDEETPPRQVGRVQPQQRIVENVPRMGVVEQTPPSQIVHVAGNVPRWPSVEQTPPNQTVQVAGNVPRWPTVEQTPPRSAEAVRVDNVSRWPVVEQTPVQVAGNVPRWPAVEHTPPRKSEVGWPVAEHTPPRQPETVVKSVENVPRWPVAEQTPPRQPLNPVRNESRWEMAEQTPPRQVVQVQPRQIVQNVSPQHTPPKQVYPQYLIQTPPRQILEIHQNLYRPYESTPPKPAPISPVAPQPVYMIPYVQDEQTPPKQILHVPQPQPYAPNLHKQAVERWHEQNSNHKRPILEGNPGFSNFNHPQKSFPRYPTTTPPVQKSYQNPSYFTTPPTRDREPTTTNLVRQSYQSQATPPTRDREPNPSTNSVQMSYQSPSYHTTPPTRDRDSSNPTTNYQSPNYHTTPPTRSSNPNYQSPNYHSMPSTRDVNPHHTTPPIREPQRKILSGTPGFSNVNYPQRESYHHRNPSHYPEFHSPDNNRFQYYNQSTYHSPDNYAYPTTSTFHSISSNGHYTSYPPWNSPHSLASGSNYHQQSPVVKPLRRSLVPQMHDSPYYGNC